MVHIAVLCGVAGGLGDAVFAVNVVEGLLAQDEALVVSVVVVNVIGGGDVHATGAFVHSALSHWHHDHGEGTAAAGRDSDRCCPPPVFVLLRDHDGRSISLAPVGVETSKVRGPLEVWLLVEL